MVVPHPTDENMNVTHEVRTALQGRAMTFHYYNNASGVYFDEYYWHPFPLDSLWTQLQRNPSVVVMESHGGITGEGYSALSAEPYSRTTPGREERDRRIEYLAWNQHFLHNGELAAMGIEDSYSIAVTRKFFSKFWTGGACFVAHGCSLAFGSDLAATMINVMDLQMVVLMYGGSGYAGGVTERERFLPWKRLRHEYGGDLATAPNAWTYDLMFQHPDYGMMNRWEVTLGAGVDSLCLGPWVRACDVSMNESFGEQPELKMVRFSSEMKQTQPELGIGGIEGFLPDDWHWYNDYALEFTGRSVRVSPYSQCMIRLDNLISEKGDRPAVWPGQWSSPEPYYITVNTTYHDPNYACRYASTYPYREDGVVKVVFTGVEDSLTTRHDLLAGTPGHWTLVQSVPASGDNYNHFYHALELPDNGASYVQLMDDTGCHGMPQPIIDSVPAQVLSGPPERPAIAAPVDTQGPRIMPSEVPDVIVAAPPEFLSAWESLNGDENLTRQDYGVGLYGDIYHLALEVNNGLPIKEFIEELWHAHGRAPRGIFFLGDGHMDPANEECHIQPQLRRPPHGRHGSLLG